MKQVTFKSAEELDAFITAVTDLQAARVAFGKPLPQIEAVTLMIRLIFPEEI